MIGLFRSEELEILAGLV